MHLRKNIDNSFVNGGIEVIPIEVKLIYKLHNPLKNAHGLYFNTSIENLLLKHNGTNTNTIL